MNVNHSLLIWSVCTFVESRVQEEIRLEELVRQTGFSLAHIRDVFRQDTGKPLTRYIQERKIANAAQELLYTDGKILDIAVRYGYSGRTVFSRVFRRYTGCTPSEFRSERPALKPVRLCAGVFGPGLPGRAEDPDPCSQNPPNPSIETNQEPENHERTTILYGVPKVAYGPEGCTPFPMCLHSCARYLGIPMAYTQAMAESGAAFRLVWNTAEWDGGNVDAVLTFDDPDRLFASGLRAMGRDLRIRKRTPETKKEEFTDFIRSEIDSGNPVIALGVIGPPEACVIAGYRDGGETLTGWNVFQEYPENQACVQFEANGYFSTRSWWENPETLAAIATGAKPLPPLSLKEVLQNAVEALQGRMCGTYAKGTLAYDAWKNAILRDSDFPPDAVFPLLTERMMCHGDAMDCLSDGRCHAALYLRRMAELNPAQAEQLNAAAREFERVSEILWKEMVPALGGWGRGEKQVRQLAKPENRRLFAAQIERMKAHDEQACACLRKLAASL